MRSRSGMLAYQLARMLRSKGLKYGIIIGIVAMAVCFAQVCMLFWGHDIGEVPSAAVAWIGNYEALNTVGFCFYLFFLMPFISAATFGDSFFCDVKSGLADCLATRDTHLGYIVSGCISAFLGGLLVVLVPLAVFQLLTLLTFPLSTGQDAFQLFINTSAAEADVTSWYGRTLFPDLFINNRYLLNLLFSAYDALWGGIIGLGAFSLSLVLRRSRLVVVGAPAFALVVCSYILPGELSIGQYLLVSLVLPRSALIFVLMPLLVVTFLAAFILHEAKSGRGMLQ